MWGYQSDFFQELYGRILFKLRHPHLIYVIKVTEEIDFLCLHVNTHSGSACGAVVIRQQE